MLESLYKEAILDHYKRPRNRGELAAATRVETEINPSCGDELELFLRLEDERITGVSFVGEGCAISQASASMMTEAVAGKTLSEAREMSQQFKDMLRGEPPAPALGELKVLQGVAKLHARVKCAALAWVALDKALASD